MSEETGLVSADVVAGNDTVISDLNLVRDDLKGLRQDAQTAGETINGDTLPVACFFDNSDDEWYACDANVQTKLNFKGFAITNGTDGNAITIQFHGIVGGFTGLTKGAPQYVQDDKTIGSAIGTYEVRVGIALSTTEILIDKGSFEFMGTASINAGSGSAPETSVQDTITMPTDARFAIISANVTTKDNVTILENMTHDLTISRKGKTSATGKGKGSAFITISASLSGNTITITGSGSSRDASSGDSYKVTGTAYYYR